MNRDLFLAILAVDAYNRDYGSGVKIEGDQLGLASIIDRIDFGVRADSVHSGS